MLAAEAAPCLFVLLRYRMHRPEPGANGGAGAGHDFGEHDARLADVAAWARDQLADLMLQSAAERAGQVDAQRACPVLAASPAGHLDHLVKLLVAEPQRGGDVSG